MCVLYHAAHLTWYHFHDIFTFLITPQLFVYPYDKPQSTFCGGSACSEITSFTLPCHIFVYTCPESKFFIVLFCSFWLFSNCSLDSCILGLSLFIFLFHLNNVYLQLDNIKRFSNNSMFKLVTIKSQHPKKTILGKLWNIG